MAFFGGGVSLDAGFDVSKVQIILSVSPSLCLLPADKDARYQLLPQDHVCLPAATPPTIMILDSSSETKGLLSPSITCLSHDASLQQKKSNQDSFPP